MAHSKIDPPPPSASGKFAQKADATVVALPRSAKSPYTIADDVTESADPMESYAKDYVDQKFETERAKTDARFAEVLTEIRLLRLSSITKWQFFGGLGTAVATILGVLLAVLAFAGDRFDAGINMSDDLTRIQAEQAERDAAQDARLDQILSAIEALRQVEP